MKKDARIFVAGHRGLVGSALIRRLREDGYGNVLVRTREELDLTHAGDVDRFFKAERPEVVFLAAGRVGGIKVNSERPAEFLRENLLIQTSVLHAAARSGVDRLVFFASSCVYPRECPQPMREEQIGTGPVEPTSEAYATAKTAGIVQCRSSNRQYGTRFMAVIPATLYGPGDNFDPASSHVISGLIRRFHENREAPELAYWGTGEAVREFLYVDDLADACLFLAGTGDAEVPLPLNIGTGRPVRVRELAEAVHRLVGATGTLKADPSKPDGAPKKVLDVSRINTLGWRARTPLEEGLKRTYAWYLEQTTPTRS